MGVAVFLAEGGEEVRCVSYRGTVSDGDFFRVDCAGLSTYGLY